MNTRHLVCTSKDDKVRITDTRRGKCKSPRPKSPMNLNLTSGSHKKASLCFDN